MLQVMIRVKNAIRKNASDIKKIWKRKAVVLYCNTDVYKRQPHRCHVVKTRITEEEYDDFTERLKHYDMSQSEFIRQAITRATIRPRCV